MRIFFYSQSQKLHSRIETKSDFFQHGSVLPILPVIFLGLSRGTFWLWAANLVLFFHHVAWESLNLCINWIIPSFVMLCYVLYYDIILYIYYFKSFIFHYRIWPCLLHVVHNQHHCQLHCQQKYRQFDLRVFCSTVFRCGGDRAITSLLSI